MMNKKECIAMLLAGGQGSRLGLLTSNIAKPAVSFGGKNRIIDFSLSNCSNSHINTVGVLTQYRPYLLNKYIGTGAAWDMDDPDGGVAVLPPYATETGGQWYRGTADAIYQNLGFIDTYDPDYVLILSGDHLYRMDYQKMLKCHREHNADLTISVMQVPWDEASRFGIMTADDSGRITKFAEKPKEPESNLASMGIYIFSRDVLKKVLIEDSTDPASEHDFGKNIIPKMLASGNRLFSYEFSGYWKDVGTISSYHETSMSLLGPEPEFELDSEEFPIMSNENVQPPHFVGEDAEITGSIIADGSVVEGTVIHSVVSIDCRIGKGAVVKDSVLLPGARIGERARITRAIVNEGTEVPADYSVGSDDADSDIAVVGSSTLKEGGAE